MKYDMKTEGFSGFAPGDEPSWLQTLRAEARKNFQKLGIPHKKMEDWRYTNLKAFAEIEFSSPENPSADEINKLLAGCNAPEIESYSVVLVNGRYQEELSNLDGLPKGVTITSLKDAIDQDVAGARKLFNTRLKTDEYAFQALNTGWFSNGIFLSVEKNAELDKPLMLYTLSTSGDKPAINFPRNLFVFGENSQATIVEVENGNGNTCSVPVTEVFVHKHAKIRRFGTLRAGEGSYRFITNAVIQAGESDYKSLTVNLDGQLVRNDIFVDLDGDDINSSVNGLYHLTGSRQTDNFTRVRHLGLNSESVQIFKGILDDKSRGVFDGRIFVAEGAQKTDAVQTNRNLLLSDDAVSNAKPQLEIYADDVACTHGATTGQLDKTMLFYLRSRGYDEKAARAELTYAFAAELVDEISIEPFRDQLRQELFELLTNRA